LLQKTKRNFDAANNTGTSSLDSACEKGLAVINPTAPSMHVPREMSPAVCGRTPPRRRYSALHSPLVGVS